MGSSFNRQMMKKGYLDFMVCFPILIVVKIAENSTINNQFCSSAFLMINLSVDY